MLIILLDEAKRQFEREDGWWQEHRDAKDLFVDEFEQTMNRLGTLPEAGQPYRYARGKLIRRWLMRKTACHVYYFHDREQDLLEIHSLWGARRRRGPIL